jgi:muramoyltetrapeptide carboxypeptidase
MDADDSLIKPRALRPGDRVALVAPASPFDIDEFHRGAEELRGLGFEPVYDDRVFARHAGYLAGSAGLRAASFLDAWQDTSIAALIAVRGGYGSVHLLPLLPRALIRARPKLFIGYSDTTSLLTYLTQHCGIVAVHGPMIERRLSRGEDGYDRASFLLCVSRSEPMGEVPAQDLRVLCPGEAAGTLTGGTLSQLVASLGTPYAFDPPAGCLLFLEDVAERPYRIDRMVTQLRLAGILERAAGVIWGEMPRCEEAGGSPSACEVIARLFDGFDGPVVFGLPSGHTDGRCVTIPLGVRARLTAGEHASVIIEESAVQS